MHPGAFRLGKARTGRHGCLKGNAAALAQPLNCPWGGVASPEPALNVGRSHRRQGQLDRAKTRRLRERPTLSEGPGEARPAKKRHPNRVHKIRSTIAFPAAIRNLWGRVSRVQRLWRYAV